MVFPLVLSGVQIVGWHASPTSEFVVSITLFIIFVSLFRVILSNLPEKRDIKRYAPESSLIIILGVAVAFFTIIVGIHSEAVRFNAELFFLFLIPPIIVEAGYFLHKNAFFSNFGLIIIQAFIGTLLNSLLMGFSLYSLRSLFSEDMTLIDGLMFGSLIAAVDPVAVLAIFEELHVTEKLNVLVFGESVLNDAVSIVLFHLFLSLKLAGMHDSVGSVIIIAVAKFLYVSAGGILVGIIMALLCAMLTKYTSNLSYYEPLFAYLFSFLSYFLAEMLLTSGIMAILFCGIVMSRYVELNLTKRSSLTLKNSFKMIASSAESLIFAYVGIAVVLFDHNFDFFFCFFVIIFVVLFRFMVVFFLTFINNYYRPSYQKVNFKEQFVLAYGGLRGAIAMALAFLIPSETDMSKQMVSATLLVIFFTIFVLGTTIRPILNYLELKEKRHSREYRRKGLQHEEEDLDSEYNQLRAASRTIEELSVAVQKMPATAEREEFENANRKLQESYTVSVLRIAEKTLRGVQSFDGTFESVLSKEVRRHHNSLKRIREAWIRELHLIGPTDLGDVFEKMRDTLGGLRDHVKGTMTDDVCYRVLLAGDVVDRINRSLSPWADNDEFLYVITRTVQEDAINFVIKKIRYTVFECGKFEDCSAWFNVLLMCVRRQYELTKNEIVHLQRMDYSAQVLSTVLPRLAESAMAIRGSSLFWCGNIGHYFRLVDNFIQSHLVRSLHAEELELVDALNTLRKVEMSGSEQDKEKDSEDERSKHALEELFSSEEDIRKANVSKYVTIRDASDYSTGSFRNQVLQTKSRRALETVRKYQHDPRVNMSRVMLSHSSPYAARRETVSKGSAALSAKSLFHIPVHHEPDAPSPPKARRVSVSIESPVSPPKRANGGQKDFLQALKLSSSARMKLFKSPSSGILESSDALDTLPSRTPIVPGSFFFGRSPGGRRGIQFDDPVAQVSTENVDLAFGDEDAREVSSSGESPLPPHSHLFAVGMDGEPEDAIEEDPPKTVHRGRTSKDEEVDSLSPLDIPASRAGEKHVRFRSATRGSFAQFEQSDDSEDDVENMGGQTP
eukprot:TRINITY_DN5340_c0_g1_i2.p1 TRINITY_DN5340_c0_g1~~TRINITY_DN5340_c0_g1_i2.p1  ORF type:complete len:1067 (-),score=291.18 TRINITY_DN5340_c0_g1_i2:986-4186(-)